MNDLNQLPSMNQSHLQHLNPKSGFAFQQQTRPMNIVSSNVTHSFVSRDNQGLHDVASSYPNSDAIVPYSKPPSNLPNVMRYDDLHSHDNSIRCSKVDQGLHDHDSEALNAALTLISAKHKPVDRDDRSAIGIYTNNSKSCVYPSVYNRQGCNVFPSSRFLQPMSNPYVKVEPQAKAYPILPNLPPLPNSCSYTSHESLDNNSTSACTSSTSNSILPLARRQLCSISSSMTHTTNSRTAYPKSMLGCQMTPLVYNGIKKFPFATSPSSNHSSTNSESSSIYQKSYHRSPLPVSNYCKTPNGMSIYLVLPDDEDNLSPLHCFVRRHCIEAFVWKKDVEDENLDGVSRSNRESSISEVTDKRSKRVRIPKALIKKQPKPRKQPKQHKQKMKYDFVGIRCKFCTKIPFEQRSERSITYPSSVSNIYYSMETWQRRHATRCKCVPGWVKDEMEKLTQSSKVGGGGRRLYWVESAMKLGMVDTKNGIKLIEQKNMLSQPVEEISTISRQTMNTTSVMNADLTPTSTSTELVLNEEKNLVTEFLYTLVSQMERCEFTEEDRSSGRSKIKTNKVGFPGMQCKHCRGKAGFGRYFPASIASLNLANSDRNMFNHLMKCRKCPLHIKERLLSLRQKKTKQKYNQDRDVSNRGMRKDFFRLVWSRLHHNLGPSPNIITHDVGTYIKSEINSKDLTNDSISIEVGSLIKPEIYSEDPASSVPIKSEFYSEDCTKTSTNMVAL